MLNHTLRHSSHCIAWLWINALCLAACGGTGSDPVAGVLPPATPLSDAQAIEAASGAAVSLISALSVLGLDAPEVAPSPAIAGLRAARSMSVSRVGAAGGAGARAAPCTGGGTIEATCAESGGRTIVVSRSTACGLVDDSRGVAVVTDGELDISIDALGVCQTGTVPPSAARTLHYRHFRATVHDGPLVIESFTAPLLTERLETTVVGCGDAGRVELDGRLLVARSNGVDVTLDAHQLELRLSAAGEPCVQTLEATGRLDVFDHAGGRQFSAALRALRASFDVGSTVVRASIDGAATLDCVGAVAYASDAPLSIGGACASRGVLRVTLPSGVKARATLSESGIEFDYDGDGAPDRSVESCTDPSVAACD